MRTRPGCDRTTYTHDLGTIVEPRSSAHGPALRIVGHEASVSGQVKRDAPEICCSVTTASFFLGVEHRVISALSARGTEVQLMLVWAVGAASWQAGCVQVILGHAEEESSLRYFGVDIANALTCAEPTEVRVDPKSVVQTVPPAPRLRTLVHSDLAGSSSSVATPISGCMTNVQPSPPTIMRRSDWRSAVPSSDAAPDEAGNVTVIPF